MQEKKIWENKQFLIMLAVALIGVIALIWSGNKNNSELEALIEQEEIQELSENELLIQGLKNQEVPDMNNTEVTLIESAVEYGEFKITNKEEFVDPIAGQWRYKFIQILYSYAQQEGIDTLEAVNVNISINQTDDVYTDFFFEYGDEDNTMVVVSYHMIDKTCIIAPTEYTKEEVEQEVWVYGDAPAIRDIEE